MKVVISLAAALTIMTPLAAKAAQQIELKLAFPPPSVSHFYTEALLPWAQEVEKATDGAVKIHIYTGGTIATHRNVYDRVLNDVADIGFGLHALVGKTFQKTEVTTLPGLQATGPQCTAALWQLYETGVIADEYQRVHPLAFSCLPASSIISRAPLRSLRAIKGLKIGIGSRTYGQEVELLGGAPITIATNEIYESLQRGLIDGDVVGMAAVAAYKLTEVAKYYLNAPFGQTTEYLIMNKASYAKLPEAVRKVFDSTTGASLSTLLGKAAQDESNMGLREVQSKPELTLTEMSDEELSKLQEKMAPVITRWLKVTADGPHVLAAYKAELAKTKATK
jgi:TRAP-type transport system periplasmic protein